MICGSVLNYLVRLGIIMGKRQGPSSYGLAEMPCQEHMECSAYLSLRVGPVFYILHMEMVSISTSDYSWYLNGALSNHICPSI